MRPTEHHQAFIRTGRWCTRVAGSLAKLDLPETLRVPTQRPILFAGNHRSFFDVLATLAIFSKFDVSSRILIRADLVDNRIPGTLLRSIGSISTSAAKRQSAEDEAVAALTAGHTVSMMPEGRLVPVREREEFGVGPARPGLSRIARRSGASVVPVAFIGTDKVWPRGKPPRPHLKRPTVTLRLGEPMEMVGDDDQANTDEFMAHLGEFVRKLEAERA
ncbi:MAG: lysophospholipid acyltransferase family protein [Acidimicrobiales bacterium]